MRLLVAESGGEWRGCLPVHSRGAGTGCRCAALATWRGHALYGLLGTPLVSPSDAEETLAALLAGLAARAPRLGFAALDWLAEDGGAGSELGAGPEQRSPRPLRFERFERAALRAPARADLRSRRR